MPPSCRIYVRLWRPNLGTNLFGAATGGCPYDDNGRRQRPRAPKRRRHGRRGGPSPGLRRDA